MLIDYQNVLMVNFVRGQKVVPAGWLLSADGPEISQLSLAHKVTINISCL